MKVKNILDLLSSSARYKLVGARTGKTLCTSWNNKQKYIAKFHEHAVAETPIFPALYTCELNGYTYPVIAIWVSGE